MYKFYYLKVKKTHLKSTNTKCKAGQLKIKATSSAWCDISYVKWNTIHFRSDGHCQSRSLFDLQFILRWSRKNFSASASWLLTQCLTDVWPLGFNVIMRLPLSKNLKAYCQPEVVFQSRLIPNCIKNNTIF